MNICAFVDALGISVRPAEIVSVLSAATNHFSADKERPCSHRWEVSFEYQRARKTKISCMQSTRAASYFNDSFSFYKFPSIYLNRTG